MTLRRSFRLVALVVSLAALAAGAWLLTASILYSPVYVARAVTLGESDVGDYLNNFPTRPLTASTDAQPFPIALQEARVEAIVETAARVDDLDAFLAETSTQSFIVIHGGEVVLERYSNGWRRDSMVTSFSVAKSFVSTLIGIAIEEGAIGGVDDPITTYLPELIERDARFEQITIRHLLMMSSGLAYRGSGWFVFNGDDPLTTYHPDQRTLALTNTRIEGPPGETFSYNKYHPQLLGMILERTTGMSVTAWTQSRLWDPLGMEYDGAWTLDSEASGFEKLEAGLNARPIDFAKLGSLFLGKGRWGARAIVSSDWVAQATESNSAHRVRRAVDGSYYAFMWWGVERDFGSPDFYAWGDHGQFIYASPRADVVIVRTGVDYGVPAATWTSIFSATADGL